MTRPLRTRLQARVQGANADEVIAGCHVGLAFDRFAPTDDRSPTVKRRFFDVMVDVSQSHRGKEGDTLANDAFVREKRRLHDLCADGWGTRSILLTNPRCRFISGLGISHPFEAGFSFSQTLGVPILPGSSVKGLAREWARIDGWDARLIDLLFGLELIDADGPPTFATPAQGLVQFSDLAWRKWGALEVDLVNPHYSDYYVNDEDPADWMQPVPSFFLTAAPQGKWFTSVLVPPVSDEEALVLNDCGQKAVAAQDVALLGERAVIGALGDLGGGGKTMVGYGEFVLDHEIEPKANSKKKV